MSESIPQFNPEEFLKSVTRRPGVYIMYAEDESVLYVGKAKNLRSRLSSYFRASGLTTKTMALVARIANIQVTVTATETEALLLEQNLIKQYRPPYNILLKDDKAYPYICVSSHDSPRLSLHRGKRSTQNRYYGPYPSASAVRESLSLLQKVFKVRQCEDSYFSNRSRPCLQYQINRCSAPCVNKISPEAYEADVRRAELFLSGKSSEVVAELADKMEQAAADMAYEKAAEIRDQISYLQHVQASQFIEGESGDLDIIAAASDQGSYCVQLLFVRQGRVLGSRSYFPSVKLESEDSEIISAFIAQHYLASAAVADWPKELIVSSEPTDAESLQAALANAVGRNLNISSKVRGHRSRWLALALTAADQNLKNRLATRSHYGKRLEALQEALELSESPERMECFDISHSSGEATVASCVVFDKGGPSKAEYRRFNIKGVTGGDDYGAMKQALERRYRRVGSGEVQAPDILFIDGGKGQLSMAKSVLESLQIHDVLMIGVAKGSDRKAGLEVLIRGDNGREMRLPSNSPALHLIQHIRDESHRFAIGGHKQQRDKARRQSTLESIPGVGAKRRRELLRHFGGLQGIKAAHLDDLRRVPGISEKLAQVIYDTLRSN